MPQRTPTRRTVLTSAAATAGATLGGVGTVSAATFQVGDCVEVAFYDEVYRDPCPDNPIEFVSSGTEAYVEETCEENNAQSVYLDFFDSSVSDGWMASSSLREC